MNLIMSDVEETILIVDGIEEPVAAAPPAVRVSRSNTRLPFRNVDALLSKLSLDRHVLFVCLDGKEKDGYVICERGRCYTSE